MGTAVMKFNGNRAVKVSDTKPGHWYRFQDNTGIVFNQGDGGYIIVGVDGDSWRASMLYVDTVVPVSVTFTVEDI